MKWFTAMFSRMSEAAGSRKRPACTPPLAANENDARSIRGRKLAAQNEAARRRREGYGRISDWDW